MSAHVHAALMLQYAQDAAETDTPWERWEYSDTSTLNQHGEKIRDDWYDCGDNPDWRPDVQYRRKPQVIRVGRHEFPKPISNAPLNSTNYFFVTVGDGWFEVGDSIWVNNERDNMRLESGRIHLTCEAAQAHADTLNAICRGDIE